MCSKYCGCCCAAPPGHVGCIRRPSRGEDLVHPLALQLGLADAGDLGEGRVAADEAPLDILVEHRDGDSLEQGLVEALHVDQLRLLAQGQLLAIPAQLDGAGQVAEDGAEQVAELLSLLLRIGGEQQHQIAPLDPQPIGKRVGARAWQRQRCPQDALLAVADPVGQRERLSLMAKQLLVADRLDDLVLPLRQLLQHQPDRAGAVKQKALQYLGQQGIQRDLAADTEGEIADDGHGVVVVHRAPSSLQRMAPL